MFCISRRFFVRAAAGALLTAVLTAVIPPSLPAASSAPMYFNYQGRLKKDSKAVSDFRYFRFRLTDDGGASEYYTSGSTRIYVTNGLFNYKVGPLDGVDFAANAMYIEVSVGESSPDNLLLPRERLVSSPYAIYAASAAWSVAGGTATYAQNSAALGTRAFDAFVSTRAENQTVGGVKTFTAPSVFQSSVSFSSATFSGNVGIGVASPQGNLHIIGSAVDKPYIFVASHTIGGFTLMVSTDGYVVVGSDVKLSGNKFQVNGSAGKTAGGTSWADLSDARLKNIKGNVENILDKINSLRPVKYEWNDLRKKKFGDDPGVKYGFVAQEMKEIFPEFIGQDTNGYYTYNPSGYEAVLTAAIRELSALVQKQQKEIDELKKGRRK